MRHSYGLVLGSTVLAALALAWTGYGAPQQSAAKADIQALRAAAWEQIRAVLTDDQKATLDAADLGHWQMGGQRARGGCGGKAGAAQGQQHGQWFLDRLTQQLTLTDDQRTSVQAVLDKTRAAEQARHEQARTEFRAVLTPEQVAKLDELKGQPGTMGLGHFGHGHRPVAGAVAGGPLQLTPEQKTQAQQIFTQARADAQKLRADGRGEISSLLTDAQKTEFDTDFPALNGPGAGKMHGHHAARGAGDVGLLDRLTTRLNLTDAQRTSIQSILDNLHTAVRARFEQARSASGATTPSQAVE